MGVNINHDNLDIRFLDSKSRFILKYFGTHLLPVILTLILQVYYFMSKGLPDLNKDFSSWYTQVVNRAGLADYGPVKGTMVIKPYGFQLWENIRETFDSMIKKTGHVNAYFPLFIPKSFLAREHSMLKGLPKNVL